MPLLVRVFIAYCYSYTRRQKLVAIRAFSLVLNMRIIVSCLQSLLILSGCLFRPLRVCSATVAHPRITSTKVAHSLPLEHVAAGVLPNRCGVMGKGVGYLRSPETTSRIAAGSQCSCQAKACFLIATGVYKKRGLCGSNQDYILRASYFGTQ